MIYSFTQISQYLTCPRRYRFRYLDGWKEKDNRAAMLFGRAFEQALGAYFRREDPGDVLFREWSASKDQDLRFAKRDSWDRMFEQGIMLLTRFCQDDRVRIPSQGAICRSNSYDKCEKTTSSPTLTGSENSMEGAASWNGRHQQVATPMNRQACWLSTRNWFAIRGSAGSRKLRR